MEPIRIDFVNRPTLASLVARPLTSDECIGALVALGALTDAHHAMQVPAVADALKDCDCRGLSPCGVAFREAVADAYADRARVAVRHAMAQHEEEWHRG